MNKNTGGPAFPGSYTGNHGMPVWSDGMTLRDYFAAKAMQAALSIRLPEDELETCAKYSYAMADAMLAVRDKV